MKRPIVRTRHLVAVFLLIKWSKLSRNFCSVCSPENALPVSPRKVSEMLVALGYEPNCDLTFASVNWNTGLEKVLQQLEAVDPDQKLPALRYLDKLQSEVLRGYAKIIQNLMAERVGATLLRLLADSMKDRLPTSKAAAA